MTVIAIVPAEIGIVVVAATVAVAIAAALARGESRPHAPLAGAAARALPDVAVLRGAEAGV
jgi:hypothetical protein